MRKEYDFSKGERGKFYNASAQYNLPLYLEPDIQPNKPNRTQQDIHLSKYSHDSVA